MDGKKQLPPISITLIGGVVAEQHRAKLNESMIR